MKRILSLILLLASAPAMAQDVRYCGPPARDDDGVSQIVLPQLDLALSTIEPIMVTPRVYASDEPDGPAHNVAAEFELTSATVTETRVSCTAAVDDAANVSYPAITFTRAMYPGLTSR